MIETLHWLLNTPGIGGLIVMAVFTTALVIFASSLLWVRRSAQAAEDAERSEPNET